MDNLSVWGVGLDRYGELTEDIERNIVVIGGGIAGFLTAYRLCEAGQNVTLVEANTLFSGVTARTTAKITANQGDIYADLARTYGIDTVRKYYESQIEGMRAYCSLIDEYGIDCGFEEVDSYIYSEGDTDKLEDLYRAMRQVVDEVRYVSTAPMLPVSGAVALDGQYIFDPIKFLTALPVRFEVYEHTRVINIDTDDMKIRTDRGSIRADKIVIATHYPIINSHGLYMLKLRQSVSFAVSVSDKSIKDIYLAEEADGLSVRSYAGGVILGGCDRRTGRRYEGAYERLEKSAKKLFGNDCQIVRRWFAQDCMTFDGMPMAGKYSRDTDNIFVVTGFNKWGMTNSIICAGIITDLIMGRQNKYAELFSPARRMKGVLKDFVINSAVNVGCILKGYYPFTLKGVDDIAADSGDIVWYHGKRRAVYKAKDGRLYVIGRMCPHLHGELVWSGDTHSWECPCHGTRLDIYGNILDSPAVKSHNCIR